MTIKSALENLPRRHCLYWIALYNSVFVLSSIFLFSAGCNFLAIILISSYFASGCQYCDFPSTLRLNNNSLTAIYFYSVTRKLRRPLSTCSIDVCDEITTTCIHLPEAADFCLFFPRTVFALLLILLVSVCSSPGCLRLPGMPQQILCLSHCSRLE